MESLEPKKLALIRILQILQKYSDRDHPLRQEDIVQRLKQEYGLTIERKAIGRNLSLLREAGFEIESARAGSYLDERTFTDAELRILIDGVLSSKYITAKYSRDLIDKLCGLSNRYFRSHVRYIYSVGEWDKTDNQALFCSIELVDEAIEKRKQICFDYNKYGIDKRLHKTHTHYASPYQLILHNQRYYLMARDEYWKNLVYYRLDRITNMRITDQKLEPITTIEGYEGGINYSSKRILQLPVRRLLLSLTAAVIGLCAGIAGGRILLQYVRIENYFQWAVCGLIAFLVIGIPAFFICFLRKR